MAKDLIKIENTRFIFSTNFEGNPDKDKYKSNARKGNVVLTEDQARELINRGFNVKVTKPQKDSGNDYEPTYFVAVNVHFGSNESMWPKIYLVNDEDRPIRLGPDEIGMLDDIWVKNVDIICGQHEYDQGKFTLYVRVMYVTQNTDEDPFADKYNTSFDNKYTDNIPF